MTLIETCHHRMICCAIIDGRCSCVQSTYFYLYEGDDIFIFSSFYFSSSPSFQHIYISPLSLSLYLYKFLPVKQTWTWSKLHVLFNTADTVTVSYQIVLKWYYTSMVDLRCWSARTHWCSDAHPFYFFFSPNAHLVSLKNEYIQNYPLLFCFAFSLIRSVSSQKLYKQCRNIEHINIYTV